jgi:hypothetical protein
MPKAKRQSSLLVFFSVLSSMVHYYRQPHRNHSTSSIRNLKVVQKKKKFPHKLGSRFSEKAHLSSLISASAIRPDMNDCKLWRSMRSTFRSHKTTACDAYIHPVELCSIVIFKVLSRAHGGCCYGSLCLTNHVASSASNNLGLQKTPKTRYKIWR